MFYQGGEKPPWFYPKNIMIWSISPYVIKSTHFSVQPAQLFSFTVLIVCDQKANKSNRPNGHCHNARIGPVHSVLHHEYTISTPCNNHN